MEVMEIIRTCILSVSALAGSCAVIWGINQYRLTKRDKKASRIKTILTRFKCNCETMMSLLSYELVDEVVNVVVYSENVQFGLYKFLHQITSEDEEEIEWPVPITAAVSSPYLMQFRYLMNSNNELCIEISSILPSVSRIFEGVQAMFSTQLRGILELSHHEGLYTDVVTEAMKYGEENIYLLKAHMVACIIGEISRQLSNEQANIQNAIKLLEIVNTAFLALNDKEIIEQVECENKIEYKPIADTYSIFDDFHEAEKGLEKIMTHEDLMLFRELCVSIRVQNKMNRRN